MAGAISTSATTEVKGTFDDFADLARNHGSSGLIHRSFSWSILLSSLWLAWKVGWKGFASRFVLAIVAALMVMGLVLSTSGIHAIVQVPHVGIAGILVSSAVYYWWLASASSQKGGKSA